MNKGLKWGLGMVSLAMVASLWALPAEARRLGGGASFGQRAPAIQRDAPARQAPTRQTQDTAGATRTQQQSAAPGAAAGGGAAAAASRRGMFGALAAGLGLAALFSVLGFGEAMAAFLANMLMFGLLILAGVFIWRLLRGGASPRRPAMATAGAGGQVGLSGGAQASADVQGLRRASHEPMPRSAYQPDAAVPQGAVSVDGTPLPVAAEAPARGPIPDGFDVDGFLQGCKRNFVGLQSAWDAADLASLRTMMTDEMLTHIQAQLAERGDQPNRTDVLTLQAELIMVEDLGLAYLASVEFTGMIREEVSAGATPFREIWNMTKPKDGSAGWLLAGVQALQ